MAWTVPQQNKYYESQAVEHVLLLLKCHYRFKRRNSQAQDAIENGKILHQTLIIRFVRLYCMVDQLRFFNWLTLSSRCSYHKAKLVFLCLHSLVPSYFSLYFTRFSNIHNYSTRQSMRLSLYQTLNRVLRKGPFF